MHSSPLPGLRPLSQQAAWPMVSSWLWAPRSLLAESRAGTVNGTHRHKLAGHLHPQPRGSAPARPPPPAPHACTQRTPVSVRTLGKVAPGPLRARPEAWEWFSLPFSRGDPASLSSPPSSTNTASARSRALRPGSRPALLGVSRSPSPEGLATTLSPWGEDAAAQTTERPSLAQAPLRTPPCRPPWGSSRRLGSWAVTSSACLTGHPRLPGDTVHNLD